MSRIFFIRITAPTLTCTGPSDERGSADAVPFVITGASLAEVWEVAVKTERKGHISGYLGNKKNKRTFISFNFNLVQVKFIILPNLFLNKSANVLQFLR